jgi:predicted kinase
VPKPAGDRLKAGTLHLVCGKIASGKSTLCRKLAGRPGTVLISQDRWISRLHPGEIRSIPDMIKYSARLRHAMGGHIADLLRAGLTVVLEFPANRIDWRRWMLDVAEEAGAPHILHYLDVPAEVCRERLRARNAGGAHEYVVDDAAVEIIVRRIQPPEEGEGLNVVRVDEGSTAGADGL